MLYIIKTEKKTIKEQKNTTPNKGENYVYKRKYLTLPKYIQENSLIWQNKLN